MTKQKWLALAGVVAVAVLGAVAHSAYAGKPAVHLALEIGASILGALCFAVPVSLWSGGSGAAPAPALKLVPDEPKEQP